MNLRHFSIRATNYKVLRGSENRHSRPNSLFLWLFWRWILDQSVIFNALIDWGNSVWVLNTSGHTLLIWEFHFLKFWSIFCVQSTFGEYDDCLSSMIDPRASISVRNGLTIIFDRGRTCLEAFYLVLSQNPSRARQSLAVHTVVSSKKLDFSTLYPKSYYFSLKIHSIEKEQFETGEGYFRPPFE